MVKESKAQKDTIHRVMEEYKDGDLERGQGGGKVKSRKQAIAIALNEAGASKYNSPSQNREKLKRTKSREAKTEKSRAELYAEAKKRNIEGRSKMSKEELARALA
ncbi:DUF6496 domain-containing protein [Segnochrobactrum spirostomi]|uniref:Rho termination factor n=1 Tax=Segnochrobactrum spirostomi TaxID=2608987 RepID=A0A6A7Y3G1_9HYPH|nr:DUF6496 domain-containing protein [Segnochrobactrum spirostomi]MQT13296.1 hypothetical protein [Segnochrobactrum spirostomi]